MGVLLHPTALPSSPVSGSFGEPCRRWIDLLADHNIGIWQLLPLTPPDGTGSPYSSPSSFALNPWFLDANDLLSDGYLTADAVAALPDENFINHGDSSVNIALANQRAAALGDALLKAWPEQSTECNQRFKKWCGEQHWLHDYACFSVIHDTYQSAWWDWPELLSQHDTRELRTWSRENNAALLRKKLQQWHLNRQWQAIRAQAAERKLSILGDLPFYVSSDSADVWANRHLFSVNQEGELSEQSGVPPDYFSDDGQLWGTPVYRWSQHRFTRFRWWRQRFKRQLELADQVRLDHFRALAAYWSVPGQDTTAKHGSWVRSPGRQLLASLKRDNKGILPLIAEDLGVVTPDVEHLRDRFNLYGMKVLQFAFDGNNQNPYLPENIIGKRWAVYTGTHDNPTTLGWWKSAGQGMQHQIAQRINGEITAPAWHLLDMAFATSADYVIAPLQDLMHLDDEARFNTPGTTVGNWIWRLQSFDNKLEGAIKGYGERGGVWGRDSAGSSNEPDRTVKTPDSSILGWINWPFQ